MPPKKNANAGDGDPANTKPEMREWPPAQIVVDGKQGTVILTRTLPDEAGVIMMGARDIRPSNGEGAHALVAILHNRVRLDYDRMNVEKSAERTRLANKAFKRLAPAVAAVYPDYVLHRDLDTFCWRVDRADEEMFTVEDLPGKDHEVRFQLEPYIAHNSGTIMFAKPGSTKSYLALLMAVSLDAGVSAIWPVARPVKVLFINLERSRESMAGRLARVNRVLGLPEDRTLPMINARGKTLSQVAAAASRAATIRGSECIFLDSISRAGGDLNDNKDANAVMDLMNGFGGAWLCVAHPPLANENRPFGSQMFGAAADLTVQVLSQRKNTTTGTGLKMIKFNDIPPRETQVFALDFDANGLTAVRLAKSAEFPDIEKDAGGASLRDVIAGVLPYNGGLTTAEIYAGVTEDGLNTTMASVRTTLNAERGKLFRSWREQRGKATVTIWGLLERG